MTKCINTYGGCNNEAVVLQYVDDRGYSLTTVAFCSEQCRLRFREGTEKPVTKLRIKVAPEITMPDEDKFIQLRVKDKLIDCYWELNETDGRYHLYTDDLKFRPHIELVVDRLGSWVPINIAALRKQYNLVHGIVKNENADDDLVTSIGKYLEIVK